MQRRTTEQARRRQQPGSTPHDLITADQRALPDLFLLARRPPRSSSHSCAQFAQNCARKYPAQPTAHSSAPTRSHWLHCKIVSARLTFAVRHCRSRPQISIAFLSRRPPAAPKAHYLPTRFRALALFGRRLSERVVRSSAAGVGLSLSTKESHHACESFCHVIRLHCGTATPLLGCAERSKPRSRLRRAEGAGLDGECADRAIIIVAARDVQTSAGALRFYFVESPFINMTRLLA